MKVVFFISAFFFPVLLQAQEGLQLWYKQPARTWEECLPLGNGRLGAMPDGGITEEKIVLNDITLWSGGAADNNKEDAIRYLPEIRKLLFEGKIVEAESLLQQHFLVKGRGTGFGKGANLPYGCFQMLGDLHLKYSYDNNPSLTLPTYYRRELSLENAVAKSSYTIAGVNYHREYFASFSNDIIIVRLTADQPRKISFSVSMDRPERYTSFVQGDELSMSGQLNNGTDGQGMRYRVRVKLKQAGGTLTSDSNRLVVENADTAILYIAAATDFRGLDHEQSTLSALNTAMATSYEKQKRDHIAAYQKLFFRASLSLENQRKEQAALPTDERLKAFEKDPADNGLPVLYFQFGRYLLISSTRPDLLPPNLQGLWANTIQTPWNGDYHLNINIQMNHWPLNLTNLPMLNEPFYRLVESLVEHGEKTAWSYYRSEGWIAYSSTNVWGYTSPGLGPAYGAAISGSGWLCQMLWDHYAFTKDTAYLSRIYPIIKKAAVCYSNILVKDPATGWLVTAPSSSPENSFLLSAGKSASTAVAPTIDNQVIRALFSHVMEAAKTLGRDAQLRKKLKRQQLQLPPNQIDSEGRLMEWLKPYQEKDRHHRHVSHLWGLYPGNEISLSQTPDWAAAAKASLISRGDNSTGWSSAWKINLWARLHNGERAFKLLTGLLRPATDGKSGTYPNLFDACPPFQIDGNFGGTAGIAEMLLQSHDRFIEFLPALPDAWSKGRFSGLCVRGGGEVSLRWEGGRPRTASINAVQNNTFHVKIPPGATYSVDIDGAIIGVRSQNDIMSLKLLKGQRANIVFQWK